MHQTVRKVLTSKYLIIPVAALLLYTLAGFFVAPRIIQWYVPKFAQQSLDCRADVGKVRINPLLLTLEMEQFSLQQADEAPLAAFARLFVDLEMSSLFRWAVVVRELNIDQPEFHLVVEPDGSINFEKLATAPPPPEPAPANVTPVPLLLQSVVVSGGRINVVDKRQSTPADFTLQALDLQLENVATIKDWNGTYRLAATTDDQGSVEWNGELSLAPFRSQGKLTLKDIGLASLWKFFRDNTNLEHSAGQLNVATEYRFNAENNPGQMTLDGLRVSLADLSLKLRNTEKPFLQLKKVDLSVPSLNLGTREVQVSHLLLEDGAVDARINESGTINLEQILSLTSPKKQQKETAPPSASPPAGASPAGKQEIAPPAPPETAPPLKMRADAIEFKNIAVDLDDKSRATPFKAAIAGLNLRLQANLEMGDKTNTMLFQKIASEINGINVKSSKSKEPLLTTEKLTVENGTCDLAAQAITFDRITMSKGRLDAGREADGTINWQQLMRTKGTAAQHSVEKPLAKKASAWKFLVKSFEVNGFSSRFSDLTTRSAKPVLSLQGVKAKLTGVDGTSPMGFAVDFQVEQGGTAAVQGTLNPALPSVEADVQVSGVVLTSLQPYLEPYVTLNMRSASVSTRGHLGYGLPKAAHKAVYEGSFSLDKLQLTDTNAKKPYLSWDAAQLPKFKLTLEPNRLDAQELKLIKPVGEFIIGEDKTLNFAKVVKKQTSGAQSKPANPKLSKQKPSKQKASKPAPKKAKQQSGQDDFVYQIGKVRVDKGNILFADLSLRPQFMTRIHDLKGTVTGLSSVPATQAKVQLDGRVDQYGVAKISGVIRPSDFARASDIDLVFRNLEMKNLSPYSGKFAGRLIKSGKFSADLSYTIKEYKMEGENKIVIDNLTLGDKVEDPDAANLPLDLAIALLKDANGRIDVGLPVTGDLNDPQFSIGSLVWKMFTNLITKATTAPFRALGSLLGGETENFDAVAFDPGNAELPPPEKEKLLKLADALKSRPQLKLVVQGRYSPEADGQELKERSVSRTVATRLGAKLSPNDIPEPLEFTDSGTQDILEELYVERFGKAALNELEDGIEAGTVKPRMPSQDKKAKGKEAGMLTKMVDSLSLYAIIPGGKSHEQATLWAGELYTRLVESEKIGEATLLQLAGNRAQSIAVHLETEAQIPKGRVRIKDPEPFSGSEPPSVTLSLDAI